LECIGAAVDYLHALAETHGTSNSGEGLPSKRTFSGILVHRKYHGRYSGLNIWGPAWRPKKCSAFRESPKLLIPNDCTMRRFGIIEVSRRKKALNRRANENWRMLLLLPTSSDFEAGSSRRHL
jgi:hypothetical protein